MTQKLLMALLVAASCSAFSSQPENLKVETFSGSPEVVVPIVGNITSLTDAAFGTLVYDQASHSFRGLDSTGAWATLSPAAIRSEVYVTTPNGYGSPNSFVRRFSVTAKYTGTSITYLDSVSNGGTFTINDSGIYSLAYCGDSYSAAGFSPAITVNSVVLNAPANVTDSVASATTSTNTSVCLTTSLNLGPTDVVRIQSIAGNQANSTAASATFRIAKISN